MIKKLICLIVLALIFFVSDISYSAVITEIEPNNAPEKANPIAVGDTVRGQINYGDGDGSDYFKLVFPQSGIATVNISVYPSDCIVQVSIAGFHPNYPTNPAGFVRSDSGRPLSFSFSEMGNKTGYVSVSPASVAGGVCVGSDWCAVQCTPNGPYYLTPFTDRPAKKVPSSYNGKPVLSPIQYQFNVALQVLPDSYEPNHEEGMSKEQMLQKGMIKTIPIGQEITAYLFNEYPMMMRGTKGSENYGGGENDTDIYHIYLNQPDTVKVTLNNFPHNANSRIIITDSSGSWDESKTGATYFERKVTKNGNVFIEISKGRGNGPLVYSATPYRLVVTTGSAVVTQQPYQPPITTQPDAPITQPYQPPVSTSGPVQTIGWNDANAYDKRGKNGQQFTYNCSPNGAPATVWGADVYTDDSSICTSAVHAGLISFQAGGTVTIEIRQGLSSYAQSTRNGVTTKGYGSWPGSFIFVGQISPQPYQPQQTGMERELINNGALRNLDAWTIHEWYKPSDGKGEVTGAGDGIRFKSFAGNNRIGIMQMLNTDVFSCSSLILTATVKADYQTLTGTGWQGREAPVAVFMSYTDVNGTVHNQLSENPGDTARRMFWHGLYYADPTPPSLTVFGTKVNKSSWHTYEVDLMSLNPRPKFIYFIGAEGAGWAQRDGKIGSMTLKCVGVKF